MQEDSRNVWLESKHIIYLLEALLVLSDIQHELLAWSMEKRILPQQRELVKSILEPNFRYLWNIPFTLDPKLLALLQEEGVGLHLWPAAGVWPEGGTQQPQGDLGPGGQETPVCLVRVPLGAAATG